jgi:hypothetical protein
MFKIKVDVIISFLLCSAVMFSNVKFFNETSISYIFTISSILFSFLICKKSDFKYLFIIAMLILISTIINFFSYTVIVLYVYKLLSIFPVIVLARHGNIIHIYKGALFGFLSSTILAILLIVLGYSYHKFIIYMGVIPRFAALAIEPVSFALAGLVIFFLYLFAHKKQSKGYSLMYYFPMIVSVSSVTILKILVDAFRALNLKKILFFVMLAVFVFIFTRASDSIEMRLFLYGNILKDMPLIFFGSGFYQVTESAGLPGILRIYYELGFVFLLWISMLFLYRIINQKLILNPFLMIGMVIPLIIEAYGAPFYWIIPMLVIFRTRKELLNRSRDDRY